VKRPLVPDNSQLNATVKELLKLVYICQSYDGMVSFDVAFRTL